MAALRLPRREAQLMRALQRHARSGVAEVLTADLAREAGMATDTASAVLRGMADAGVIENILRASRSRAGRWRVPNAKIVEASRPRGAAVAGDGAKGPRAPVAPQLFDWIVARLDPDGTIEMSTRTMADGVGVGVSTVESLLARWKIIDAVRVERRGGPFGPTRWRFDPAMRDEASGCPAVHPNKRPLPPMSRGLHGVPPGIEPPMRPPVPVNVRCPFCNMPPSHADCRHGWNGLTTRAQRRMIAAEASCRDRRLMS